MTETNTEDDVWGESKLDNEGTYPKTFKIKQGKTGDEETHNVFRVLPAMKKQIKTGKIAEFHKIHYGYYVPNPKYPDDPTKKLAKPFVCIEVIDFQTKMVLVRCPECENIKQHQEELKETEASFDLYARDTLKTMKDQKKPAAEIQRKAQDLLKEKDAKLAPLKDWLKMHNLERKWHVNVKSQEANMLGDLHISNNLWKDIKAQLKKLGELWKCDPLAPTKGVWIDIVRTGNGSGIPPGSAAKDKVEVQVEFLDPNNPMGGSRPKMAPLTKEDAEKAKTACRDVADPSPALKLDSEIIEMLVSCDESYEEVARILKLRQPEESPGSVEEKPVSRRSEKVERQPEPTDPEDDEPALQGAVGGVSTLPQDPEDEEAELEAKLAAARAKKAAKAEVKTEVKTEAKHEPKADKPANTKATKASGNSKISEMSDEAFLDMFEDPEAQRSS